MQLVGSGLGDGGDVDRTLELRWGVGEDVGDLRDAIEVRRNGTAADAIGI